MAATPTCAACKKSLPPLLPPGGAAACPHCAKPYEAVVYPAATASRRLIEPRPAEEGEATCFFHASHRADHACDQCGRLLCPVCTVAVPAGLACPACAVPGVTTKRTVETERVLYNGIATFGLLITLLMIPFAVVTAPVVIGILIYGARRPRSLVRPGIARSWAIGVVTTLCFALGVAFWIGVAHEF